MLEKHMELQKIQNYIYRDLGITVSPIIFEPPGTPFFLRRQFVFYKISLLDKDICLLLSQKQHLSQHNMQEIISAFTFFQGISGLIPVIVFPSMSKQERLALVRLKISFLVPEVQMFIPSLCLDFSEHIPERFPPSDKRLRPAAQALIIQQMLTGGLDGLTVNQISKVMGYSAMGTLRAVNQLHDLGICKVAFDGYRKTIDFPSYRKILWEKSRPFMRNPVKKTFSVEDDSMLLGFPLAGEFALGNHSDLSVARKTYALQQQDASRLLKIGKLQVAFAKETGCADVQIWTYRLPSWNEEVDLFSLELSFLNSNDPRIKIALLNLEAQNKW